MEIGMIGLGKMGGYMTERLIKGGHRVVGFDRDAATVQQIAGKGAQGANSLESLVTQLKAPRVIWLMVPRARQSTARLHRCCRTSLKVTRSLTAATRIIAIRCAAPPN